MREFFLPLSGFAKSSGLSKSLTFLNLPSPKIYQIFEIWQITFQHNKSLPSGVVLQNVTTMLLILFSLSFWLNNPVVTLAEPTIEWLTETEYDFGDVIFQKPVQHTFRFKNTGTEALVIENVRTSCGCTGSTWDETPILPDSTGRITVEFDAKQSGYFRKYARVFLEGKRSAEKLWVSGFVVGADE